MVVAAIDRWATFARNPKARILRVLGTAGEPDPESAAHIIGAHFLPLLALLPPCDRAAALRAGQGSPAGTRQAPPALSVRAVSDGH